MSRVKRMATLQRQKPIEGGRIPLHPCVISEISAEVERLSRKFGVAKSFVIAVALADQFGIGEQEQYVDRRTKGWAKPVLIRKRA